MADLIDQYFRSHLGLEDAEAIRLHKEYYTQYGLAIEGLVRHHQIDPLDYNAKVDAVKEEHKKLLEEAFEQAKV